MGFFGLASYEMQYVFVVLNTTSGVFILLHSVVFNRGVREASRKAYSTSRTLSSKVSVKNSNSTSGNGGRLSIVAGKVYGRRRLRKQSSSNNTGQTRF